MTAVFLLVAVTVSTLLGDYFIKLASHQAGGMGSANFALGALFYGLPAFGWFVLMRGFPLAAIGAFYSAATIVMLAIMGRVLFDEPLGAREALGLTLALLSVVVMSRSG